MDIELARTFLEVVETGNFKRAADRLNVTQSTVSMRIKTLEDLLGQRLFRRSKVGADLTAAGHHFNQYALTMVRAWQQARQDIALPSGYRAALNVGAQFGLWERLLVRWLPWMRTAVPDVALRAEVGFPETVMEHVTVGLVDIGLLYNAPPRPHVAVERVLVERIVMVATDKGHGANAEDGYVMVDLGADFRSEHGQTFPDRETPAVTVNFGPLGLDYILANGGAGYFPLPMVRQHLEAGRLHRVADSPEFTRTAYLVYPAAEEYVEWFKTALQGLRHVAAEEAAA
ncbi:MAG: LysR family transcriptional regulator [Alphaproteobacteria bacterium]|nr:LysR family transcriptional regulator [Alphaproteobacteria bacterium]